MKKQFIALCLIAFLFGSCQTPSEKKHNTANESTSSLSTDSSGESESETTVPLDTHETYLDTVTYLDYELTGSNEPCYIGRWFEKEIEGISHMVTLTDGATMYFLINGASSFEISYTVITGNEIPYYAYSIDGSTPQRKLITDNVITLPDSGRHTVRIIADGITENVGKWTGEKGFAFRGIIPSEGGEVLGIRPKNKVIFFFGDSITEGIAALGRDYVGRNNSATNAYPWFCSEELGTVPYYIGYGGSGIINGGSFSPLIDAIRYNSYNRPVIDTTEPDIILINHGSNDYSASDRVMETCLKDAIAALRKAYPDAPIVYMIPFNQTKANVIASVMKDVPNSYIVETNKWNLSTTDGTHPNARGAKKAGTQLAEALKSIFGEDYFS